MHRHVLCSTQSCVSCLSAADIGCLWTCPARVLPVVPCHSARASALACPPPAIVRTESTGSRLWWCVGTPVPPHKWVCSLPDVWLQATAGASSSSSSEGTKALDSFTRDLCAAARENRTDPVRLDAGLIGTLLSCRPQELKPLCNAVAWN